MRFEILQSPAFGMLKASFDQRDDQIVAESGAMVACTSGVKMSTATRGGVLKALKSKVLGGVSLFCNTFTASGPGQHVLLAPPQEGDLRAMKLAANESFYFVSGAYLGHTGDVALDTQWQGARSILSGVGFFMLKVNGPGTVFYASYGAIERIPVPDGGLTVDNGQIVGFSEGVRYTMRKFGGFRSFFLGGEGLVCHFEGDGEVLVQTRNVAALASFLHPYRPVEKDGGDRSLTGIAGKLMDSD